MGMEEISSESRFNQLIGQKNKLTVIDFKAEWCGPCKMIEKPMSELPAKYPNASFAKVDVDKLNEVASAQGIRAMPTICCYISGEKVDEVKGADMRAIEAMVQKHYGKSKSSAFEGQGNRLGGDSGQPSSNHQGSAQKSTGGWLSSFLGGGSSSNAAMPGQWNDDGEDADLQKALLMSVQQEEGRTDGKPAEIQIRLADGKTLKHTFSSNDTLGYVQKWVASQGVGGNFALALAYPRKQFAGEQLNRSLEEEGLANRGQLLVIPK